MKICDTCDHNIKIECKGGCFSPYKTPPCFRKAIVLQAAVEQKLRAEIASYADRLERCPDGLGPSDVVALAKRWRQLSVEEFGR